MIFRKWRAQLTVAMTGTVLAAGLVAAAAPASATASSHPTLRGNTGLTTAPGIAHALIGSGVLPLPAPGTGFGLKIIGGLATSYRFPITGGNPSLVGPKGNIFHSGGINFVSVRGKHLEIGKFDIDLKAGKIYADQVNFKPGRIPVLDLDLSKLKVKSSYGTTVLSGISTKLESGGGRRVERHLRTEAAHQRQSRLRQRGSHAQELKHPRASRLPGPISLRARQVAFPLARAAGARVAGLVRSVAAGLRRRSVARADTATLTMTNCGCGLARRPAASDRGSVSRLSPTRGPAAGSSDDGSGRYLVRSPSGVLLPADIDPFHRRLHRIAPAGLLGTTTQTSGMQRKEAISGRTVGAQNLWMGQTHVPVSTASANHHHGGSETAIYVVSGTPVFVFLDVDGDEPIETRIQTAPGDYVFVPPYVPHREENPDPYTEAVVVIARTTQEAIVVNLDTLDWSAVTLDGESPGTRCDVSSSTSELRRTPSSSSADDGPSASLRPRPPTSTSGPFPSRSSAAAE